MIVVAEGPKIGLPLCKRRQKLLDVVPHVWLPTIYVDRHRNPVQLRNVIIHGRNIAVGLG